MTGIKFKPTHDWPEKSALSLFKKSNFTFPVDTVHYLDFIKYSYLIPDNSINSIIADPPFGISFSGKESFYNRKSSRPNRNQKNPADHCNIDL